jgi:hypothetical protein
MNEHIRIDCRLAVIGSDKVNSDAISDLVQPPPSKEQKKLVLAIISGDGSSDQQKTIEKSDTDNK